VCARSLASCPPTDLCKPAHPRCGMLCTAKTDDDKKIQNAIEGGIGAGSRRPCTTQAYGPESDAKDSSLVVSTV
jgi:hypothetical protein